MTWVELHYILAHADRAVRVARSGQHQLSNRKARASGPLVDAGRQRHPFTRDRDPRGLAVATLVVLSQIVMPLGNLYQMFASRDANLRHIGVGPLAHNEEDSQRREIA